MQLLCKCRFTYFNALYSLSLVLPLNLRLININLLAYGKRNLIKIKSSGRRGGGENVLIIHALTV